MSMDVFEKTIAKFLDLSIFNLYLAYLSVYLSMNLNPFSCMNELKKQKNSVLFEQAFSEDLSEILPDILHLQTGDARLS